MTENHQMSNNENHDNTSSTYSFHAEDIVQDRISGVRESIVEEEKPKKRKKKFVFKLAVFVLIAGIIFAGSRAYFYLTEIEPEKKSLVAENAAENIDELEVAPPKNDVKKVATTETTPIRMISQDTVSLVTEQTLPSIVSIQSTSNQNFEWFGQQYNEESVGSGSGFIIDQSDEQLLIATNNHVIEGATKIEVSFIDDTTAEAVVKATDSFADLAVISVDITNLTEETMKQIKVAKLGDSEDVKVGELSIAIGNALGYGQSVTVGYISAKNRSVEVSNGSTTKKMTLLQTDAAINPGNSGGALLNAEGEVIGINTVKYASTEVEGMGYAIPISKAQPIMRELMNSEELADEEKGFLGITGRTVTEKDAEFGMPYGTYVVEVVENGSADKAGMMVGDIITKVNDIEITDITQLRERVNSIRVGETIQVTYLRAFEGEYEELEVDITLMKNPELEIKE